jgi:hypothetical protein
VRGRLRIVVLLRCFFGTAFYFSFQQGSLRYRHWKDVSQTYRS